MSNPNSPASEIAPPRLNVTSLSQYVRLRNCDRYLRFRINPSDERHLRQRWGITIQPLTPLLKEEGLSFEQQVTDAIRASGEKVVDLAGKDVETTVRWIEGARNTTILLQASLEGQAGPYFLNGIADIVRLSRNRRGELDLYIADVKASRAERMEHRLQIAVYAYLLRDMAQRAGVPVGDVRGAVLHAQEDGVLPAFDAAQSFDLDTYLTVFNHLVLDEDSTVRRIAALPFDQVPYHLGYQCDGCMYNALCMYDSAERQDLSLVPYISATEKHTLQQNGIRDLRGLAELMDLEEGGYNLVVPPDTQDLVTRLSNQWPLGVNLPTLVLRAKRALQRFDRNVRTITFLPNGNYGTMPTDDEHPGLIKVFFDAQHDYLQDRVYLLAALVVGPKGQQVAVRCTNGPPEQGSEEDLLTAWVNNVLAAIATVAEGPKAPIHLYCYNSYDQRMLLESLKRHLHAVTSLPGFFDLMTQSPALSQPIISFLAKELEERRILGQVCTPLHDAARGLGFDWSHEGLDFFNLFRARLFDNRRTMVRSHDGRLVHAPLEVPAGDPRRITIESASRFNSQIPLEYAYSVWGQLPDDPEARLLLRPFRSVTAEQLRAFAAHRVRALAFIEASFKWKARFMEKPAFALDTLTAAAPDADLAQSLKEFLFMEHHSALQAKLQVYGLPIERRVQTGLALLLKYSGYDQKRDVHRFSIAFHELDLDPVLTMNALRLKEGAWVVINPAGEKLSANKIKNGRLAIIQQVESDSLELILTKLTFYRSKFRYPHKQDLEPEVGGYYTLDEMADDMNADKVLESLGNAGTNVLYRWLLARPADRVPSRVELEQSGEFVRYVNSLDRAHSLTGPQTDIVAGQLDKPLVLVQGPPGTGKSHTIGWAVLNRLMLAAAQGRPFRVVVSCKTHNATNIVLDSIAKKWARMKGFPLPTLGRRGMPTVTIAKICGDEADPVPDGVAAVSPYTETKAHLEALLAQKYVVIGGTPGGLYNLARYREVGGTKKIDWAHKDFDLVVIDEASQMSVPEAVLACAFVKQDGSIVVVGDHRQMPPIVAHDWEQEEKRSVVAEQPFLSLFEYLMQKGFPRVSLDQSFRLHESIATFLQDNIYVHDGIHFFSKRKDLLMRGPATDAFVDVVMKPEYPIVVIEHGETGSHQYNEAEMKMVEPLIRCALSMRLDGADGIGVVVPHRAQRALLRQFFPELATSNAIDTVERFQGGERDVIIVSATASDPDFVLAEADFLLNLNRLNVALSRPRKKLIVVASRSVTKLLMSDLDVFENAVIWKRLYYQYANTPLWSGELGGAPVWVRGHLALDGTVH